MASGLHPAGTYGFEDGSTPDGLPVGWFRCGHAGYQLGVDFDESSSGVASGVVRSVVEPHDEEFGGLGRCIDAEPFRGSRTRYVGWLRTESVVGEGAGLWMRIDLPNRQDSILDNMRYPVDRAITGTTAWAQYEIVLDVPVDATRICFGFLLAGTGTVWADDLRIGVLPRDVPGFVTPAVDLSGLTAAPGGLTRRFYGRESELEQFGELLDRAHRGVGDSSVMVLHGIGGIGKSTLLGRLRSMVDQRNGFGAVSLDWAEVKQHKPAAFPEDADPSLWLVVAEELTRACEAAEGLPRSFKPLRRLWKRLYEVATKAEGALRQAGHDEEEEPEAGRRRLGFPGAAVEAGGGMAQVVETVAALSPGIGVTASAIGSVLSAIAASPSGRRRDRLRNHVGADDLRLLDDAFAQVADVFAACLRKAAARQPVAVFLDTYEIVKAAGPWLRRLAHRAGPRVVWVVAGRFDLGGLPEPTEVRAFRDALPGTVVSQLSPFDERILGDLLGLAAPDRPLGSAQLRRLLDTTEGIPLAVWLAAELWAAGAPLETITSGGGAGRAIADAMVNRLLLHLGAAAPDNRDLFRIHRLALLRDADDVAVLSALWHSTDSVAELRSLVRRYDFLFTGGHRLHDSVRDALRVYLLDSVHRESVREANQAAADLLEQRLGEHHRYLTTLERRLDDERWVSDMLALVWHRYWISPQQGVGTVLAILPAGIVFSSVVARSLLDLAEHFAGEHTEAERRLLRALHSVALGPAVDLGKPAAARALADLERRTRPEVFEPDDGCEIETRAAVALLGGRIALRSGDRFDRLDELVAVARRLTGQAVRLRTYLGRTLVPYAQARLELVPDGPSAELDEVCAVAELASLLQPNNPEAHRTHGDALYVAERYPEALAAFTRYAELSPNSQDAMAGLAETQLRCGDWEAAWRVCQRTIEFADVHHDFALLFERFDRLDEASAAARQAVESAPWQVDNHVLHAELALRGGDRHTANAAASHALTLDAESWSSLAARAYLLHRLDNVSALADYQRAQDLRPHDPWLRTRHGLALAWFRRADEAIRTYLETIREPPDDPEADSIVQATLYWCERPDLLTELPGLPDAIDEIRNGRDIASLHYAKGLALYGLARYQEALASFDHVTRLDPDNASAHLHVALTLDRLGRAREALTACRKAARLSPEDHVVTLTMAELQMAEGDFESAAASAMAAIELDPKWTLEPWVLAGIAAWCSGDVEAAQERFQRGLHTGEDGRETMNLVHAAELRALALLGLGRAEQAFEELREISPGRRVIRVSDACYTALATAPVPLDGLHALRAKLDLDPV